MKQIPSQYLASQDLSSFMKMRQWLNRKDLSACDISSQLTRRYRRAKSDSERLFIGRLLACAYSHSNRELADRAAGLFGQAVIKGLTAGESVFLHALGGNLKWNRNFDKDTLLASCPVPMTQKLPDGIVADAERTVIFITDDIYFTRESDGTPSLFIVNDTVADTLIDEERFGQDAPLYFTESSHFVSPVYKLKVYRFILDFILDEIGYAPLKIRNTVIFSNANLVNYSDYADGDFVMHWNGVNVVMLKEFKRSHVFPDALPIPAQSNPCTVMNDVLVYAFRVAAIIYKGYLAESFNDEPTDSALRHAVNKLKIFKPIHHELF